MRVRCVPLDPNSETVPMAITHISDTAQSVAMYRAFESRSVPLAPLSTDGAVVGCLRPTMVARLSPESAAHVKRCPDGGQRCTGRQMSVVSSSRPGGGLGNWRAERIAPKRRIDRYGLSIKPKE